MDGRADASSPRWARQNVVVPPLAFVFAFAAIGLWSTLAVLAVRLQELGPLLVAGIGLTGGGLLSAHRWRTWRVPAPSLLVGIGGILGYHVLYFQALRLAPAIEANLLNYLWPLLIVLCTPLVLRDHALRPRHGFAAVAGFAGTALIVAGDGAHLGGGSWPGYACALAAAVVWALYSLLCKRLAIPTPAVGGFCVLSGALALALSSWIEGPIAPRLAGLAAGDGAALVAIVLGPLGAAFFAWDAAFKRGDPRVIGTLAYLTPLLSTALLTLVGQPLPWTAAVSLVLIIGGALVGSWSRRRASGA